MAARKAKPRRRRAGAICAGDEEGQPTPIGRGREISLQIDASDLRRPRRTVSATAEIGGQGAASPYQRLGR